MTNDPMNDLRKLARCGKHEIAFCRDILDAGADEIQRLRDIISPGDAAAYEEGMAAKEAENNKLRGLLAWGSDPCIYCKLSRADMGLCQSGFPGCARADDMACSPDSAERFAELEAANG